MGGAEEDPGMGIGLTDSQTPEASKEEGRKFSREQIFILISCASINFFSTITFSLLAPFFPQEAAKKGVSKFVVGLIFGCFALFNFISSLIMGQYLVQIGAKVMLLAGMFASGIATILFGMLDKAADGTLFVVLCFIVRSVDAVGFGAAMTATFSILAKAFPKNIAAVMGTLEFFDGLGLVLGPPIGGILYQAFGYEIPFIAVGSAVLFMVPLNMFFLPRYDGVPTRDSFWRLFTLPKIALMCLILTSMTSCIGFLDPTLSIFVNEKFHLTVSHGSLVFLGLALPYVLSPPLIGFICDKKPVLQKWFIVIGCLGTAACFALLGPAPFLHIKSSFWLFIIILIMLGFFVGVQYLPLFPEMLSCAYENGFQEGLGTLGLVSGLFNSMWSIGTFIGPTLGGFLNDRLHFEWTSAIQGAVALAVGLSAGAFYIRESLLKKRFYILKENVTYKGK
ncbi:MFS-type transporter SLC18B1-like isoform X2 [Lissotriton helveticus]